MGNGVSIYFKWSTVLAADGSAYYFPQKLTKFMREKYAVPAVYRWLVLRGPNDGPKQPVYIGEGADLLRRMQRVLTPPKDNKKGNTNRRLHDIFAKHIAGGRKIVIDVADVEPFELNGIPFGRGTLENRFKRVMLENLLLTIAQMEAEQWELLNIFLDPLDKATKELARLMKTSPDIMRKAIRKLQNATDAQD